MRVAFECVRCISCLGALLCFLYGILPIGEAAYEAQPINESELRLYPDDKSEINLKMIPFRIIYETYRETNGSKNWELCLIKPDGSNAINLTNTPDVDEMYPHVSPDGTKICFVTDKGTSRRDKVRSVYYMNIDGTNRVKVAEHAQWPCWSPDSKTIAYLKDEYYERFTNRAYGTKGLFFYDLITRKHEQHPNEDLYHLYNICWSPDGNWFFANTVGGMGFGAAIVAFEAHGSRVFDLSSKYGVSGCRLDISSDGKRITWGTTDYELCVANLDLTLSVPRVADIRSVVKCSEGPEVYEVYHTDFSPDGRYITFSYGPEGSEDVGGKAPGWNICVSDLSGKWVQITNDGNHNKEPDWVPITKGDL